VDNFVDKQQEAHIDFKKGYGCSN